jgi:hypothetical protein
VQIDKGVDDEMKRLCMSLCGAVFLPIKNEEMCVDGECDLVVIIDVEM